MFKIQADGYEYRVKFIHAVDNSITQCTIYGPGDGMTTGIARRRPSESPNRRVARKWALKHALKNLFPIQKSVRTLFWKAYFEKSRP